MISSQTLWLNSGLLVATAILSLKTGILLGGSWLSKRSIALFSAVLGVSLWLMVFLLAPYRDAMVALLDNYTFAGTCLLAVFLIYLGLQELPGAQTDTNLSKPAWWMQVLVFLPCPFCMVALVLSTLLLAPVAGVSAVLIGSEVALIFAGMVCAVALFMRGTFHKKMGKGVRWFNNLLLIFGLLTLAVALLVPNITAAMNFKFQPFEFLFTKDAFPVYLLGLVGVLAGYGEKYYRDNMRRHAK